VLHFLTTDGTFCSVVYLYYLVRRPTSILDFSLTLVFNHLVLTTYYASSFPTSPFFWIVLAVSVVLQIVSAEQLCVRREMREGLGGWKVDEREEDGIGGSSGSGRGSGRDTVQMEPMGSSAAAPAADATKYQRVPTDER
jgi:hypothetical protein